MDCFSIIGMLPFLVGNYQPRVAAAFFETMSGFTTTGATAFTDVDALPRSILLWRSMTHWIGGMGIVFFTIAILPNMGGGELKLFSAEATGLKIDKLHPRISTTARWLWSLYLLLTITCMGAYFWEAWDFLMPFATDSRPLALEAFQHTPTALHGFTPHAYSGLLHYLCF